ncbi:hypothetical protein N7492_006476 [Penicillium capsulatum]|uniref:Glycosyltransferase family 28 N-terminal domain-containing protein n=1 Tax=Penicillium capsulatum TaxID=69766 RepID=A0A9W9HY18_9EURO|nr:hypothetical protein N7492_006476 [Penicillium capsulatum]KAJ6116317.1 hypothetical protein N7512_006042 [Penicillium capsulatum]
MQSSVPDFFNSSMADPEHFAYGDDDAPPPYEPRCPFASSENTSVGHETRNSSTSSLPTSTFPELSSTIDGRVNVDVGSRFSRNLERLIRSQPPNDRQNVSFSPSPEFTIGLNIVIQVVGSRGDVQPFVALGSKLQRYGHRVRLATHATFEKIVTDAGLEYYPVGGDPAELMSYMVRNPGLIPSIKSLRAGEIQQKRASVAEILNGCWKSRIEPDPQHGVPFVADAIIANPPSFGHIHCAQALGIPVHLMFTMPWTSTKTFPHPLANLKYNGDNPSLGNLLSYHFVEWMTWQGIGDLINDWRKDVLELDPIPATEGPNLAETLNIPFTYCWSPALVPKPQDWGSNIDVCGFFFREPTQYVPPAELHGFLSSGPSPIYIGFGSIVCDDVENLLNTVTNAIEITGVRAIISRGWSGLQGPSHPHIHYIEDCPHEWLFQQVKAVVHHGGAGTTACGLQNGKPTAIIPFLGDQPFWGHMVSATGAGPEPIPYKALNSRKLAAAIRYCLSSQAKSSAQAVADQMQRECGVQEAVQSFHAHLPRHRMQCDLLPNEPAVWKIKKGKRIILISKKAAGILKDAGHIQEKDLKRHQSKPFIIEIQRWDPLTAISSASLSTATGMADATVGIFVDPYKEYRRLQSRRDSDATVIMPVLDTHSMSRFSHSTPSCATTVVSNSPPGQRPVHNSEYARHMALASAISLGKFLGRSTRGTFIDLPLAATEGLLAVPRLYGEQTRVHTSVVDWRSGTEVAWSTCTHGLYEGLTDIFVHTYKGKKNQGALGVAKGLSTGLVSLTVKTGAATAGLIAYPNQGVYRSLRTNLRRKLAKQVMRALWAEAEWLMRVGDTRINAFALCSLYEELLCTREHGTRSHSD